MDGGLHRHTENQETIKKEKTMPDPTSPIPYGDLFRHSLSRRLPLRGDPSRLPAGTAGRVAGLDIFRGLAMINIVMIHTVFWWGERYAPAWSRNLALLVDVPLFFFLSGWAAILQPVSWKRTIHGVATIYLNYAMIVALVWTVLALVAHHYVPWEEVKNWLLFRSLSSYEYGIVLGSAWFLPGFAIVRLMTPLLAPLATNPNRDFSLAIFASVAFLWMSGVAGSTQPAVACLSLRSLAFHGLFYFLGLAFAGRSISGHQCLAGFAILASLLFAVHHEAGDAFALQNHKFPVGSGIPRRVPAFGHCRSLDEGL